MPRPHDLTFRGGGDRPDARLRSIPPARRVREPIVDTHLDDPLGLPRSSENRRRRNLALQWHIGDMGGKWFAPLAWDCHGDLLNRGYGCNVVPLACGGASPAARRAARRSWRSRSERKRMMTRIASARRLVIGFLLALAMTGGANIAAPRAGAVVGGYVEVHMLVCPPGYAGDNPFRDCHDNRLGGVSVVADGPGPRHYQDVTGEDGRVILGDFLKGGEVTIAQAQPSGDYASYQVYGSRVDNQAQ